MALLLLLILPIIELVVIVQVAHAIGVWNTLGLLLLISLIGGSLTKRAGLGALKRFQADVAGGTVPTAAAVDALLILTGGVLLVIPGFVSGAIGLLLLIRPVRALLRSRVLARTQRQMDSRFTVVDVQRWTAAPDYPPADWPPAPGQHPDAPTPNELPPGDSR